MFQYQTVITDDELQQILRLQHANHASRISESQANVDGFVTVTHTFELLKQMSDATPQIIAKEGERVIGYALVMLKSFAGMVPVLQPMFDRLAAIQYRNRCIADYSFYVMGQICIEKLYRGRGVFDALYRKHQHIYRGAFELCVTSVSTRNLRSMRAHQRVGFEAVNTFRDATDEWQLLAWPLD
jgi:hypothetical protein